MKNNPQEDKIARALILARLPFEREYRFHPTRKWRFDFAFPNQKVAIEFEGGIFIKGRHTQGAAYHNDCEKYNQAALLGWRILRYTPKHLSIKNGEFLVLAEVQKILSMV